MKKRSRLEITLKVLHIIYSGTCKTTHIMNEAGISWVHFKDVLASLELQGFVQTGEPKLVGRKRDNRINKVYSVNEKASMFCDIFGTPRSSSWPISPSHTDSIVVGCLLV